MRWWYGITIVVACCMVIILSLDNKQELKKEKIVSNNVVVDNITVKKSQRLMLLLNGDEVVRKYKISLGSHPVGAKHQQGDGKTPEGQYYISGRNANSKFHLALRISYPNQQDKEWADAHNVPAGGDIMIHGFPNKAINALFKYIHRTDWTAGCIAVTDDEIEEIWHLVKDGTPINIYP